MEKRLSRDISKPRQGEARGIKMKRKPMFDQSGTSLLNGVKLGFEKGFGFYQNPDLKNSAHCIDDNRIIYLLSSQIAIYDMLAQSQKLIDSFDSDEEVGALAYFKNIMLEDNIVYSLHSPNKSFPTLTIMNFSKNFSQKIAVDNLYKQQRITQIVLFNDYRHIAIVSRMDKIVRLTIMQVVTKQIKASQYLNFNPIGLFSLSQYPTKLAFYTGTDVILTDLEDQLKMVNLSMKKWLQLENQQKIVQVANSLHLDLSIYAITDQGNLYFINADPKQNKITKVNRHFLGNYQTLDEKGTQVTKRRKPSSICANQYNIIIGYESIEQLTLVKISAIATQTPDFQAIKFSCPFLHKIVRMSFAAETMAICIIVQVKQNDRYEFSIPIQSQFLKQKGDDKIVKQSLKNHLLPAGKVFPIVFNLLLYDTLVDTLKSPVQAVLNSMLLTKKILDICVLPTRKLILVLSADKRIKAIKYQHVSSISFDKMLAWQMILNLIDRPTTFDVHPLTSVLALGSKQGVKLFYIYSDGMKSTNLQYSLNNCQCVRYSRFGHLLVAGSSNTILLINPYQYSIQKKIQLNHGYGVKQLSFIDRDMYIFSNYYNGSSQVLKLDGSKVFQMWKKQGQKIIYSCYDPVFDIMIVSYENYEVKFSRERGQMEFAILWTYPFLVTKILLVNQLGTAFMGTTTGKIRAYQWPFTDMAKFNKSFTEIQLHKTPITQIKITHDFNYLITGAEDGTIFISKITPYSDGMIVSDSSVLHTFKVNKKNYTSLYYLQDYMCTNNCNELEREQQIMRYESDKSDSASQFIYILQNLQMNFQLNYQKLEQQNKNSLKQQIQPLQNQIQQINHRKVDLKQQLTSFLGKWARQVQHLEQKKLDTMRNLYKESDHLRVKVEFYTKQFREQLQQFRKKYEKELKSYKQEKQSQEFKLIEECNQLQKDFSQSLINNSEAMKQEDEQGKIYKSKMMEQLQAQLKQQRDEGQKLRKTFNKNNHSIKLQEQKSKYFQQLSSELQMDISNAKTRRQNLIKQIVDLGELLKQKDKQILNEQKTVKQLLKKSINNYSHEQFLKHKQDELIQKAKYLQKQITQLDDKYKVFQQNFIQMSRQTNDFTSQIQSAYTMISQLKQKQRQARQIIFIKRYKDKQIYNKVSETFHQCCSKAIFADKVKQILSLTSVQASQPQVQQKIEIYVEKRDHLIDQVVNTNKLRKIDDKIKKTLMYKLNRETVSLTSQVNELRKQKKSLTVKMRDLQSRIRQTQGLEKQNMRDISSLTDIVPINISVIRSHTSKHSKPLPFQIYQQNKLQSFGSSHSKLNSKSIVEEGSTQLPSIIKHSQSYAGGSILEQSSLFGVEENDDQVAQ